MNTHNMFMPCLTAKCSDPSALLQDKSITVGGYNSPALEEENISFSCPPGWSITGPNTSTCMGNGEWEPNFREVECKGQIGGNNDYYY